MPEPNVIFERLLPALFLGANYGMPATADFAVCGLESSGPSLISNCTTRLPLWWTKWFPLSFLPSHCLHLYANFIICHDWGLILFGKERNIKWNRLHNMVGKRFSLGHPPRRSYTRLWEGTTVQWGPCGCWPTALGATVPLTYHTT